MAHSKELLPVGELVRQLRAHGAGVTLQWRAGGPQPDPAAKSQNFRIVELAGFAWPAPSPSHQKYFKKHVASMDAALTTADTPKAAAEAIRKIAASQKHIAVAGYGRRLLEQVERHLGLGPGSLSARVVHKGLAMPKAA